MTTIAAIATPLGIGGIGVIRISGPEAIAIARQVIERGNTQIHPRMAVMVTVRDPESQAVLDQGILLYFQGPNSYTGEDVVELQLHGNSQLLLRVLHVVIAQGAQLARPGEFTRRAFINGKLDLTEAESVADLIHAEGTAAQSLALHQLKGKLSGEIMAVRVPLIQILEQIEASIDFPDEVEGIDRADARATIHSLSTRLAEIVRLQNFGRLIREGVKCVIMGRPNVGKSSLLNALLGEDRAIVSDIAGTTRDFIDVSLRYRDWVLNFVDTAGIRAQAEGIEQQGIDKIDALIAVADVALWVVDSTTPITSEDEALLDKIAVVAIKLGVANKSDLNPSFGPTTPGISEWISVSAKTGQGIDALKAHIYDAVIATQSEGNLEFACNSRQLACVIQANQALAQVLAGMDAGFEDDVLSIDLKTAILKLGEVTGDVVTEEVLDGIFSRFCVGK